MLEKTNKLTGAALDWAVAKAWQPEYSDKHLLEHLKGFQPSTNWCIGGPIIELMGMHISRTNKTDKEPWAACMTNWIDGATPLEAAMRCYAAYRLGDQVDIPEELTNVR